MPNFFQIIKDDKVLNADHVIRYHSDEEEQIHSLASVAQEFRSDFPQSRAQFHALTTTPDSTRKMPVNSGNFISVDR